ncbi:MAG TPA: DUF4037 domain-containing protein [Pyrinomonadaceae bacterium]|jgi:hypothetical protein
MSDFIPGLKLSGMFYAEAVKPVLDEHFPHLRYSAALIGDGSEVIGFDTEMSADHDWGPRLMIFLAETDYAARAGTIREALSRRLPFDFRGYSTNFSPPDPNDNGTQLQEKIDRGTVNHRVEVLTIRGFLLEFLDFDPRRPVEIVDWLTFPEQKLRTITAGAVYRDETGLRETLGKFGYYPHDVWLYLLASQWNRIGQEEHLMGRAGSVGDEIGSAIIAARLVRDLMRLCFLMEKQYAPYPKWFGSGFAQLKCAADLAPALRKALSAENWREREKFLVAAYERVAEMHNGLKITVPLAARAGSFFGRPFQVIHLQGKFADEICGRITDPAVKRLIEKPLIGSLDQISDNTDILSDSRWRATLRKLYERG